MMLPTVLYAHSIQGAIGSPALTTRRMREPETQHIATWIAEALNHRNDASN